MFERLFPCKKSWTFEKSSLQFDIFPRLDWKTEILLMDLSLSMNLTILIEQKFCKNLQMTNENFHWNREGMIITILMTVSVIVHDISCAL